MIYLRLYSLLIPAGFSEFLLGTRHHPSCWESGSEHTNPWRLYWGCILESHMPGVWIVIQQKPLPQTVGHNSRVKDQVKILEPPKQDSSPGSGTEGPPTPTVESILEYGHHCNEK